MPTTKTLAVHYLPQFVRESDLADGAAVVIDLLRASTTICTALAAGATEVTTFLEVADALRAAEAHAGDEPLMLGGERDGVIIPGFDLGNSPAEYTAQEVFGARVLFATTNGTRALAHARLARRVLVGAIVNLSALVESLQEEQSVHLLCAGTGGHVTREDQLAAGAIVDALSQHGEWVLSQPAESVIGEWRELLTTARALGRSTAEQLALELRDTPGGKNLIEIGMEDDLPRCAAIDTLTVVPEYDPATGRITT